MTNESTKSPAEAGEDGDDDTPLGKFLSSISGKKDDFKIYGQPLVGVGFIMTAGDFRSLRAQPPARPTASDIAKFADANMTPEAKIKSDTTQPPAREDAQPVAAPDALRVAVEALEKIKAVRVCRDSANIWTGADACRKIATEALAALQAEQKGGA